MAGKRGEAFLVLFMVVFLASFATNSAARSHPNLQSLARAALTGFGMTSDEPCCTCACPLIWPPTFCICAGVWQGSCPSACANCQCVLNECTCVDTIAYDACVANACSFYALDTKAKDESGMKGMM